MRLGFPIPAVETLDQEIAYARQHGMRAVYVSARFCDTPPVARDYVARLQDADLVPAEVGAWCNPLSRDPAVRRPAIAKCQASLALAETVGARCCVNVAGSCGERWAGPYATDLLPETFDLIVATVQEIIDAVKPGRTFYSLETMPWMLPDSPESYRELLQAIDRPAFAAHFDPVNLVNSPRRYFQNGALIRDFVRLLGPQIRSVHLKDILLGPNLTVHLDECRPGAGGLDYPALLNALKPLDPDLPVMLEHLPDENEYLAAAAFVRTAAATEGIIL